VLGVTRMPRHHGAPRWFPHEDLSPGNALTVVTNR
jgi:hypothetical protein